MTKDSRRQERCGKTSKYCLIPSDHVLAPLLWLDLNSDSDSSNRKEPQNECVDL